MRDWCLEKSMIEEQWVGLRDISGDAGSFGVTFGVKGG